MKKVWIFIALSGALAVVMGALSAHLLKSVLAAADISRIQTAATYQIYHTLVLLVLVIYYQSKPLSQLKHSIWLFILGIVLFSGSLYAYSFSHIHSLVYLTPIGGMLLIVAWLSLLRLLSAIRA